MDQRQKVTAKEKKGRELWSERKGLRGKHLQLAKDMTSSWNEGMEAKRTGRKISLLNSPSGGKENKATNYNKTRRLRCRQSQLNALSNKRREKSPRDGRGEKRNENASWRSREGGNVPSLKAILI